MRVLHFLKTSDGGAWAAREVRELVRLGIDVSAVLPRPDGLAMSIWRDSGAQLLLAPISNPFVSPARFRHAVLHVRQLLRTLKPDVIHSHFVETTLLLRLALGRHHSVPRVFQVPGPLHLEHYPFRFLDVKTAGPLDYWIGSSRCVRDLYRAAGVQEARVFVSYYGGDWPDSVPTRTGALRRRFGFTDRDFVVGNISYIYPPKRILLQRRGIKGHEDLIDALGTVIERRPNVAGLLIGGTWGCNSSYEQRLRARAHQRAGGRIILSGPIPADEVRSAWRDFDCAVHVPLSENCGGVVEPLLVGLPTIASTVGGLPEVVLDGLTGRTVPPRKPEALSAAIMEAMDNQNRFRTLAENGRRLATVMFDVRRTAREVAGVYEFVLGSARGLPECFDSRRFAAEHLT